MKRKVIVSLIAIVAVVAAVMFAGCVDDGTRTTQRSSTQSGSKTWHTVISFSDSSGNDLDMKPTQPFTIKGNKWRVTYDMRSDSKYACFVGYAYPRGETTVYISSWSCINDPSCSDTKSIHKGHGDYYLKFMTANVDSWKLKVEDYY